MTKGLILFLVVILLSLLGVMFIYAGSALLFGDDALQNVIDHLVHFILESAK